MGISMMVFLIFTISQGFANYILNGDFQVPIIPKESYFQGQINGWKGQNFKICSYERSLGFSQFIALNYSQNAYIEQTVTIPFKNICNLTFYQKLKKIDQNFHFLEIYLNNLLLDTRNPTTTNTTSQKITFQSNSAQNTIKFKAVGDEQEESSSFYLDEIRLQCSQVDSEMKIIEDIEESTLSKQVKVVLEDKMFRKVLSTIFSLPTNQIFCFKFLHFLSDDLWLYSYHNRNYTEDIQKIFKLITEVQIGKRLVLQEVLHFQKYKSFLKMNKFRQFSNKRFLEIQGNSSVLLDSNFTYFIYSIPINLVFCCLLCIFAFAMKKFPIGKLFQKFSFLKLSFLKIVFLDNLSYLYFVCFGHIQNCPFSFHFFDKLIFLFTILFLFGLTMVTYCFYWLGDRCSKSKRTYITHHNKRSKFSYYTLLTIQHPIVKLLQSTIHTFLYFNNFHQLLVLSSLKALIILFIISTQSLYNTYKLKSLYVLQVFYYFCLLLLDLSLLGKGQEQSLAQIKEAFQNILGILIGGIVFMRIFVDLGDIGVWKKQEVQEKNREQRKSQRISQVSYKVKNPAYYSQRCKTRQQFIEAFAFKNKLNVDLQQVKKKVEPSKKNIKLVFEVKVENL